jgi:hypothetical protein
MIVSYDLSNHIKSFNLFVSSHVPINIKPDAIGSNVQLCQIFFSHNSLFSTRITSKLLIHIGLSTAININNKIKKLKSDFLHFFQYLFCRSNCSHRNNKWYCIRNWNISLDKISRIKHNQITICWIWRRRYKYRN